MVLLWVPSCADGGHPPGEATLVDSAGIRIVQLSGSSWEQVPPVHLPPTPILSMGAVDGSDAETEVAATADGLWMGTTKSDEVLWLNKLGEVERILRWAGPDRAVTERVKEAVYTEMQERWAATAPPGATGIAPPGPPAKSPSSRMLAGHSAPG